MWPSTNNVLKILKNRRHLLTNTRYAHEDPFSIFDNNNVYDFNYDVHDAPLTNENQTTFALNEPTKSIQGTEGSVGTTT